MNPRQFLMISGVLMVVLSIAGMFVLGPASEASLLGDFFFLTEGENVVHLALGAVALGAYFTVKSEKILKYLTVFVGLLAVIAVVWGLVNRESIDTIIGVINLENPSDTVLNAVVAVWAFLSAFKKSAA